MNRIFNESRTNNEKDAQEPKSLGRLVTADAQSSYEKLNDPDFLKQAMLAAVKAGNLNVLDIDIHRFEPHGISAVLVLQESHFSVHTWPEYGYIAVDVFTCGAEGDPDKAMKVFLDAMEASERKVNGFDRGILGKDE